MLDVLIGSRAVPAHVPEWQDMELVREFLGVPKSSIIALAYDDM